MVLPIYMTAIIEGSVDNVFACLRGGGDTGWTDVPDPTLGITLLMACAVRSRGDPNEAVAIARLLMEHGASMDTADGGPGCYPAMMAAAAGHVELLSFLLERGAIFDRCPHGSTSQPIWLAAQNGHAACVAKLVQAAAAAGKQIVDATNNMGRTPLSIAIHRAAPGGGGGAGRGRGRHSKGLPSTWYVAD